jgi:hypothetical protein
VKEKYAWVRLRVEKGTDIWAEPIPILKKLITSFPGKPIPSLLLAQEGW